MNKIGGITKMKNIVTIANGVKVRLGISNCLIRQYYNSITVNYIDENGECMTVEEEINDLINERGNFLNSFDFIKVKTDGNKIIVTVI